MTAQPDLKQAVVRDADAARSVTHKSSRLWRWCFSTLGCAEMSLPQVCDIAAEFDIRALELRSLWGRVDLPACVSENGFLPETAASLLTMESQAIVVAGSSFKLVGHDAAARAELLNFSQWADSWQIPYVRVFGGGTWGKPLTDSDYQHAADAVTWWDKEREVRKWKVEILLETHDAFSASAPCLELIHRSNVPLSIIWDSHHTWHFGGEKPAETWKQLSRLVRHVHLKDSVNKPSARHPYTYVLQGRVKCRLPKPWKCSSSTRLRGVCRSSGKSCGTHISPLSTRHCFTCKVSLGLGNP